MKYNKKINSEINLHYDDEILKENTVVKKVKKGVVVL